MIALDHRPDRAAHRGERVDDAGMPGLALDPIDESERDDVEPELGVLDRRERASDRPDKPVTFHHANSFE